MGTAATSWERGCRSPPLDHQSSSLTPLRKSRRSWRTHLGQYRGISQGHSSVLLLSSSALILPPRLLLGQKLCSHVVDLDLILSTESPHTQCTSHPHRHRWHLPPSLRPMPVSNQHTTPPNRCPLPKFHPQLPHRRHNQTFPPRSCGS